MGKIDFIKGALEYIINGKSKADIILDEKFASKIQRAIDISIEAIKKESARNKKDEFDGTFCYKSNRKFNNWDVMLYVRVWFCPTYPKDIQCDISLILPISKRESKVISEQHSKAHGVHNTLGNLIKWHDEYKLEPWKEKKCVISGHAALLSDVLCKLDSQIEDFSLDFVEKHIEHFPMNYTEGQ